MAEILYVANSGDDSISVISTCEARQIKRLAAKQKEPSRLLVHMGQLYCANARSGSITRIRPDGSQRLIRCSGASPQMLVVRKKKLYVICNESNSIWRYDTRGFMAETASACGCWPVDVVSYGKGICVANMMSNNIHFFDQDLHQLSTISTDMIPLCLTTSHHQQGQRLMVCGMTSEDQGVCMALDENGVVAESMRLPWPVSAIASLRLNNAGIALSVWQDRICKIDWDQKAIVWQTKTGRMPESVRIDEEMGRIYVTCLQDGCVEIYDVNGQLRTRVAVGREPRGMALGGAEI